MKIVFKILTRGIPTILLAGFLFLTVKSIIDRQVDYEVSTAGIKIPVYDESVIEFTHDHQEDKSLPFMASAVIDIDNDGVEELFLGGAYGLCIICSAAYLFPRIGAGPTTAVMIASQLMVALFVDHYGIGTARLPLTPYRILGAMMLLGGALLVLLSDATERSENGALLLLRQLVDQLRRQSATGIRTHTELRVRHKKRERQSR